MSNQVNTVAPKATRTTNTPTQYTVLPSTAIFIDLLNGYGELYANINNAIKVLYGESQVDELFDRDFNPIMSSLEDAIFEYVKYSIQENLGHLANGGNKI